MISCSMCGWLFFPHTSRLAFLLMPRLLFVYYLSTACKQVPFERWNAAQRSEVCSRLEHLEAFADIAPSNGGVSAKGVGAAVSALLPELWHVRVSDGEKIFTQGEPSRHIYVLVTGEVSFCRQSRDQPGRQLAIGRVGAGAAFGSEALSSGQPRSSTAQAEGTAQLVVASATAYARLFSHRLEAHVVEKVTALRSVPFFASLQPHVLQRLAYEVEVRPAACHGHHHHTPHIHMHVRRTHSSIAAWRCISPPPPPAAAAAAHSFLP